MQSISVCEAKFNKQGNPLAGLGIFLISWWCQGRGGLKCEKQRKTLQPRLTRNNCPLIEASAFLGLWWIGNHFNCESLIHEPWGVVLSTHYGAEPEALNPGLPSPGLGHKDHCPFSTIKTSSSYNPSGYVKYTLMKFLLRQLVRLQKHQHLALYFTYKKIQFLLYVSLIIMPLEKTLSVLGQVPQGQNLIWRILVQVIY